MPIFHASSGSFKSLQVTGSNLTIISSSVYFRNLTTASQAYVLTYDDITGQIYYTASNAAGQGGTITSVNQGDGIAVTNPSGPTVTVNLNTGSAHFIGGVSKLTGSLLTTSSFNSWTGSNTSQFAGTSSYVSGSVFNNTNPALSASFALSSSRATTASLALTASFVATASYVTGSIFTSTNPALSASYALSSSNALTASFVITASYVSGSVFNNTNPALSASYALSSSNALTASFVVTASYVTGSIFTSTNPALSASFALTASHALNAAAAVNTGSLLTTASVSLNTITFTKGDGSTFPITVNTGSGGNAFPFSGNAIITGSLLVSGSNSGFSGITGSFTGSLTGSLFGTSSWAASASNAINAQTASFLPVGTYNITASWAQSASQALTASFVTTASYVTGSIFTSTNPVLSASYALSSSNALTASFIDGTFTQGGNSFGTTALLGTNDAQNLVFETSGSGRMFISSSGMIRIGTTSSQFGGDFTTIQLYAGSSESNAVGIRSTILYLYPPGTNTTSRIIYGSDGYTAWTLRNLSTDSFQIRSTPGSGSQPDQTVLHLSSGSGGYRAGILNENPQYTLDVSGSARVTSSLYLPGLTTTSQLNVVTIDTASGQIYYTASSAIGGGGGNAFPFNGNAVITGSLLISGSGITVTGSISSTQGFTGSLLGTASYVTGSVFTSTNPALSASFALTASHALNAAAAVNTSSLLTTASVSLNTITFTKGDGSTFPITVNTGSGGGNAFPFTGSAIITGSLTVTGSTISTLGFTGSLFGTASWATNALTASFLPVGTYQITSSWAQSASQAITASYILQAVSASFATTAITSSYPIRVTSQQDLLSVQPLAGIPNAQGQNTFNIWLGTGSGQNNIDTLDAVFLGREAGFGGNNNDNSINIGKFAGKNTTGSANIFLGYNAGAGITSSENAIAIGFNTALNSTDARYATAIGYKAGYTTADGGTLGSGSIVIGNTISTPSGSVERLNIGGLIFGSGLYNPNTPNATSAFTGSSGGRVGINVVSPSYNFQVSGSVGFPNLTDSNTATKVILLDNNGQLFTTASNAIGGGGGNAFPFNGNAVITGSLRVSGSNSGFSGITGSFTGSLVGSLTGTSSWAQSASQALTASFVVTASYVTGSIFTSTNPALSASFALSSSRAITASFANTSSYITGSIFTSTNPVLSASYALSASFATTAITSSYPLTVISDNLYSVSPSAGIPDTTITRSIWVGLGAGATFDGISTNTVDSIFIGTAAGSDANNTYASFFAGPEAGSSISNVSHSIFIGERAGYSSGNPSYSNFLGQNAGIGTLIASSSNFLGRNAGNGALYAHNSNFLGQNAGSGTTTASYSTLIGYQAGYNTSSIGSIGTNNIIIGTNITLASQRRNSINIGGVIFGTGSYATTSGNPFSGSANGRIGINVPTPTYTLDVSGSGNYTNGLTVTGSITGSLIGTASWANATITSSYPLTVISDNLYSVSPSAGIPDTTITNSIWIGATAGDSGEGISQNVVDSIFMGTQAGSATSNILASFFALRQAGNFSAGSSHSIFIGDGAGYSVNAAPYSNFLGKDAGASATTANNSNFLGQGAGSNSPNSNNSNFLGQRAGAGTSAVSHTTLIGYQVGYVTSSAGSIGANNIIIGTNITLSGSRKDSINIGGLIFGTGSYATTTGNPFSGSANGRIGINIPTPTYALDVSGSLFSGSISRFSSDIVVATRSAAPSVGVEGQIVPVNNAGTFLMYVYIGGRWRSSSLF